MLFLYSNKRVFSLVLCFFSLTYNTQLAVLICPDVYLVRLLRKLLISRPPDVLEMPFIDHRHQKEKPSLKLIREVSQIVANSLACCFAFSRIRAATHNQMHFLRLDPLTRPLLPVNFVKFSGIAPIAREA